MDRYSQNRLSFIGIFLFSALVICVMIYGTFLSAQGSSAVFSLAQTADHEGTVADAVFIFNPPIRAEVPLSGSKAQAVYAISPADSAIRTPVLTVFRTLDHDIERLEITANGFPAETRVTLGIGDSDNQFVLNQYAFTNDSGAFKGYLRLSSEDAERETLWVVLAQTEDSEVYAVSQPFEIGSNQG